MWNVSKVTYMYQMFAGSTMFNQPLEKWNVSNVTKYDGDVWYYNFLQPRLILLGCTCDQSRTKGFQRKCQQLEESQALVGDVSVTVCFVKHATGLFAESPSLAHRRPLSAVEGGCVCRPNVQRGIIAHRLFESREAGVTR